MNLNEFLISVEATDAERRELRLYLLFLRWVKQLQLLEQEPSDET